MYLIFFLTCLVFLFSLFRIKQNYKENLEIKTTFDSDVKNFIKNRLNPDYELVSIQKNSPLLTTIFWVAYKNKFKRNEFSNIIQPFIIQWRKNDDASIYVVDSIKPHVFRGNLPFIKNQNQEFANLFDVRLQYLMHK